MREQRCLGTAGFKVREITLQTVALAQLHPAENAPPDDIPCVEGKIDPAGILHHFEYPVEQMACVKRPCRAGRIAGPPDSLQRVADFLRRKNQVGDPRRDLGRKGRTPGGTFVLYDRKATILADGLEARDIPGVRRRKHDADPQCPAVGGQRPEQVIDGLTGQPPFHAWRPRQHGMGDAHRLIRRNYINMVGLDDGPRRSFANRHRGSAGKKGSQHAGGLSGGRGGDHERHPRIGREMRQKTPERLDAVGSCRYPHFRKW